jgi:hypothetical protein
MAETKEDIAGERDRLRKENNALRSQLEQAGRTPGYQPQQRFQLSEGDRQELEIRGVVSINGRLMTKADVEQAMAAAGQRGVTIADAPEATRVPDQVLKDTAARGTGIRGVDYVYPSVAAGQIDPDVAGTPGISGPPADAATVAAADDQGEV